MQQEFYSNGKLLLSGEYAILDGALGLAIPSKYGQSLRVTKTDSGPLKWTSLDENDKAWFQAEFELEHFKVLSCSDDEVAKTLTKLLLEAKTQNPGFLAESKGIQVRTKLNFPRSWGLGTSSTLINNIAQWAKVDPYTLLWNAFGGSGYDIACAQHSSPITYQLQNGISVVEEVRFDPSFKDCLYFVHLNQKQSSKEAIANYRRQEFDMSELVSAISSITTKLIGASSLDVFEVLVEQHEAVLSKILGIPPIKSQLFPEYPGTIKSLGAWGGDFVLATARDQKTLGYFKEKGFNTVIPFSQMVL